MKLLYITNDLLTREELYKIPISDRTGQVSDRWKGVNHGVLATAVVTKAEEAGLDILKEQWYCNPDHSALYGAVTLGVSRLENAPRLDIGQDANFSIGVRHSNRGAYAVSFAVGGEITVCSNGLFNGDFVLKRKHTVDLDLDSLVSNGIRQYLTEAENLAGFVNSMRDVEISNARASELILNAAIRRERNRPGDGHTGEDHEVGFIHHRYLEEVVEDWRYPRYEEYKPRTLWSLYNCFTEATKVQTPPRQIRTLSGLRMMMSEACYSNERN